MDVAAGIAEPSANSLTTPGCRKEYKEGHFRTGIGFER